MPAFPSEEWATLFQKAINENEAYATAAAAWEGELVLEVLAEGSAASGPGIYLDLAHGKCRNARYVADASEVNSEFSFRGTRENWQRLLNGGVDPVKAYLDGTIKLRGNPMKALRFTRAAKELIETAATIPTEP